MAALLVTGGAGFIGSNFIKYLLTRTPSLKVVNFDVLTYAGNMANNEGMDVYPNYIFVEADIRDRVAVENAFRRYKISHVVNFAAESHVDRSIQDPNAFVTTNVVGTHVLLDVAKTNWKLAPEDKYSTEYLPGVKFVQVSTDEVYGSLGSTGAFVEDMPLLPNSPYSATKASADLLVRAYHRTYGLPVNITRCSNNYGPNQFPEKLIPLMIYNCLKGKALPVYGDGTQVRDWIHVTDHCVAIEAVLERGQVGEVYNIGGNSERTNVDVVRLIVRTLGKSEGLIEYVQDRLGHDQRYAIDCSKIEHSLGWKPQRSFEQGIQDTIQWYLSNEKWLVDVAGVKYRM